MITNTTYILNDIVFIWKMTIFDRIKAFHNLTTMLSIRCIFKSFPTNHLYKKHPNPQIIVEFIWAKTGDHCWEAKISNTLENDSVAVSFILNIYLFLFLQFLLYIWD